MDESPRPICSKALQPTGSSNKNMDKDERLATQKKTRSSKIFGALSFIPWSIVQMGEVTNWPAQAGGTCLWGGPKCSKGRKPKKRNRHRDANNTQTAYVWDHPDKRPMGYSLFPGGCWFRCAGSLWFSNVVPLGGVRAKNQSAALKESANQPLARPLHTPCTPLAHPGGRQ